MSASRSASMPDETAHSEARMLAVIRLAEGVEMTCSIAGRIASRTSFGNASSDIWMNSRAATDWPSWAASVVRKIRKGNSENRVMKAMWPA